VKLIALNSPLEESVIPASEVVCLKKGFLFLNANEGFVMRKRQHIDTNFRIFILILIDDNVSLI
jgi:hypothetical protein